MRQRSGFPPFAFVFLPLFLCSAAVAEKAPFSELAIPDTLGVNIHFTSPKAGEMEMLAGGGFKWIRMDFTWGGTERKKGEYNFDNYDKLMESLKPHGIRALFILDYANKLYDDGLSPHSEEARQAMAKWAAAAVTHFKGKAIVWEMWNEPNIINFWKPRPKVDDYAKLALAVGKAVRAAAADEIYVGPGTSQIDLPFLEECFKAGCLEYWDGVTVHPYRQKDPETACEEYRKLRLMIAKYAPKGKKIPILSGEWGYSAAWGKFDEDRQGKYLPREFLVNLYNEIPLSIWYDWHDDGKDPKEAEHHFGTVKFPYLKDQSPVYEPKAAYRALATLSKQLGGLAYNKRLAIGDDQNWVLLFAKGKEVRVAAWTTSKTPREVTIPASVGKFTVTNHLGDTTNALVADDKGLKITLTDSVQYLAPEAPNDLLRIGAAWERVPLEFIAKAPGDVQVTPRYTNPLTRPVNMGIVRNDLKEVRPDKLHVSDAIVMQVDRSDAHAPTKVELFVAPDVVFRQNTLIAVSNPISASILAPASGRLPIQIDNPAGDAFNGIIELAETDKIATAEARLPLKFAQGQTHKVIWFNVTQAQPVFRAGLRIADDSLRDAEGKRPDKAFFNIPAARFAPVQLPAVSDLGAQLKLHVDGDKNVKSEQSLAMENAPEPLPTGAQSCLKVAYAFEAGWKFIRVAPAVEELKNMPIQAKAVGMWVYSDGADNRLRLRYIDSTGQCFQPDGQRLNFKGWKWITMPLDGSGGHWAGKDDGIVHQPIRWDSILLLDGSRREKTSGQIWVAGITLIE